MPKTFVARCGAIEMSYLNAKSSRKFMTVIIGGLFGICFATAVCGFLFFIGAVTEQSIINAQNVLALYAVLPSICVLLCGLIAYEKSARA